MHSAKIRSLREKTHYPIIRGALNVAFLLCAIIPAFSLLSSLRVMAKLMTGAHGNILSSVYVTASYFGLLFLVFLIWQLLHVVLDVADKLLGEK